MTTANTYRDDLARHFHFHKCTHGGTCSLQDARVTDADLEAADGLLLGIEVYPPLAPLFKTHPALADALMDIAWRFTAFGETDDGDVAKYLVTKGTVHRLIGQAQAVGVSMALRSGHVPEPPDDDRAVTALLYRQLSIAAAQVTKLEDKLIALIRENAELRKPTTVEATS